MTKKLQVIETIGDTGLLLPELTNEGLAANDRIKYLLTLLQTASLHAQQPLQPVADLRSAREACGIVDASLDDVPADSAPAGADLVSIPAAARIRRQLFDDTRRMLAPLGAAAAIDADWRDRHDAYEQRLAALIAAAPDWTDDRVAPPDLETLTGVGEDGRDTLHRLVMDLHRELNGLLADVALESIDGARALGLADSDRGLVAAFMQGVNRTAALKFDHPGLSTTAARYGERLSIQNDLGTTDGHIVIVQITGLTATIVYSDVHRRRVKFLQDLLRRFPIDWQAAVAAHPDDLEMVIGRLALTDRDSLERFLAFVGSRLVFLIDWNRARKRLTQFVRKGDAVAVLAWAAENEVGHHAFLQTGDARLIYTAFERVAPARIRYGARLDELLGRTAAVAFLRAVLRITSSGLQAGHSPRLMQDEIEAELLAHLATTERDILDSASEHAMLVYALAERMRQMLARPSGAPARAELQRAAALAKAWESRADEMVRNAARRLDRTDAARVLSRLLGQADEIADALEETAFLLTLTPDPPSPAGIALIRPLADAVADATREYVRCIEHARERSRFHTRAEVDEVLVSVDRIAEIEHACDAAERTALAAFAGQDGDCREQRALADVARGFELAADAIVPCARIIRDYVLNAEAADA